MSFSYNFSLSDVSLGMSYISESVFGPGVQLGKEEVKSVVRCVDGNMMPDLNQSFVDEPESFFVSPSYPQYTYGSYNLHEEGVGDFPEGDNGFENGDGDFKEGAGDFQKGDNCYEEAADDEDGAEDDDAADEDVGIKAEPNPDVSFETDKVCFFLYTCTYLDSYIIYTCRYLAPYII